MTYQSFTKINKSTYMNTTFTNYTSKLVSKIGRAMGAKAIALFVGLALSIASSAQSPIYFSSGHYTPPNNWAQGSAQIMGTVAGTNVVTVAPNGTGNQYFRFYSATAGGTIYEPNGASDILLSLNTSTNLQVTGSGKAYYLNVANTGYRYVLKTSGSGTPGTSRVLAIEVQGTTIQTVSSVAQIPASSSVTNGGAVTVTATLSGSFSTGQVAYLRYTTNSYSTSTVVAMAGSGTTYTATIPASVNTTSANISYYVFTSGTTNVAADGSNADFYTINLNNNGGSNYTYTVGTNTLIGVQDFEASPATPTMTYTTADAGTVGASSGISSGQSGASGSNSPGTSNLFSQGTQGYRVQGGSSSASRTLTFSAVNTSSYSNVQCSFRLAGMSLGTNANGIDISTDEILVEVSPDGGTTWYQQAKVVSNTNNARWAFAETGSGARSYLANNSFTSFSTIGGGLLTGSAAITTATIVGLPSVASLRIRITPRLDTGNESWLIDYLTVTGVASTPILTSPTVASITENSAVLGATVTNNGGSSLTARGTSYKTSSPVVATDNQLAEGGTSVSAFTHTRSSLSPETQYFYVGYATNATNTGISSESNFRTLSNPPTAQATSLSGTPISSSQIDLSWTAGTFPGSGATQGGYLIVYSTGTPALVGSPNGLAPASAVSVGTIVSSSATALPTTPAVAASATGLATGTAYNFLVIPYTWDGTNASTYNYYTSSPATASATTNAGAPSLTSPTATTITENSAILGATVVSDGGSSLTARGTAFKTSSPVLATDNQLAEGGTSVAAFSHSRTLAPETQYFYVGYATNASTTGISSEGNFRTLSNPPTAQASTLTASPASSTSLDHTWSAATFPGSGASVKGYVLIRANSPTTPTLSNGNGAAPAAGAGTTIVSSVIAEGATTHTTTGLTVSVTYNFVLIPFTWDGSNASTYNYLTAGAPTASGTPVPTTYTYIGSGTSSWATGTNWSPTGTPGNGDAVQFTGAGAVTVTNVPTGITLLKMTLSGTGAVTLQPASGGTLNIGGGSAPQFSIASGSSLIIDGGTAMTLNVLTANTGSISGSMLLQASAHNLTAADASGIIFNSPAIFTQGTGCSGNVFGTGTANSVVFASGSTFVHAAGSNPFQKTAPATIVVFQTGSLYKSQQNNGNGLSFSGRTYANLEFDGTGTVAASGTGALVVDNLTITQGIFNWGMTTTPGHSIKGNVSIASGATLNFSAAGTTNFNGSSAQTISGAGTLAITGSHILTVGATSTVNLDMNMSIVSGGSVSLTTAGKFNVIGERIISGAGTFTMSVGVSAQLGIGSANGITTAGNASGNIQTTTRTYQSDAFYSYIGAANQVTGGGLPAQVRQLIINNTGAALDNIVTLTNNVANQNNSTPIYSVVLTAGKLNMNNKTLVAFGVQSTGGDFTTTPGPLSFTASSTSTCNGTLNLPTVVMSQAVDFGTATTIVTSLQVNGGNVANNNPPFYGTGSTLIYNTGYGVFNEWKAGISGAAGVPYHVTVNTGFTVNLGNNPAARLASGNINVNGTLTQGTNPNALTVNGNVNIGTAGTLVLSTVSGGDIKVGGNWNHTAGATLTTNSRAIFFIGSALQSISRSLAGTLNFDYILNQNTSGGVQQASGTNVNINGSGNGLQLQGTGTGNTWDINGNTLNLATNTNISLTGSQVISSTAGAGTVTVAGGTSSVNSGTGLAIENNVTVALNGGMNFGSSLSTFNSGSTLQINAGGFVNTNAPIYATGSLLRYNSATTYGRNVEWSATSGAGYPYNVEAASGTTIDLSANGFADRAIAGSLNLIGSLTMGAMTNKLTVGSDVTVGGTLTLSSAAGGDLYLGGNWNRTGTLVANTRAIFFNGASGNQTITATGGETFDYLFVDKAAGSVVTASDLTLNEDATISNGTFEVGTGTILDLGSKQILGTGSLVVNGTFKTSKAAGFSGDASSAAMNTLASVTLGSASTVDYTSGGGQTITAINYANLSNSGDGNRILSNTGTIGVSAVFTPGAGNYTISNSTVEFNGTVAQTVPALAPDSKYNNLTINNAAGVSMVADLNLEDALTLSSGAFTTSGFNFTLLSSGSKTARIAPVTSGTITGDVVMQRFVPGGTGGWATIGMPVSSATLAEWNDDIIITGINGGASGTGSFVSIFTYDETATGNADDVASYVAATDVTNSVDAKKGYFVYIADNATTVADKLLDVIGPPLIGTQNLNVTYTNNTNVDEDGWNLVSNPFCSAIDWLSPNWTKTNMDNAIYIYDVEFAQYTGSVGGFSYNGGNEIIASSQAFLVHANAAAPSLSVQETAKSSLSPTFYRSSSSASAGVLRMQLDGLNGVYADESVFRIVTGASSNFDPAYDAYKLYSFDPAAPNISSKWNGTEYVVNSMDELTSNLDLPVRVNVNTAGNYTINFKGLQNFAAVPCLSFEDKLTNTSIDLHIDSAYTFTSAIDTAAAQNRFVLHFGVESIVPAATPSTTNLSLPGNATVTFANTTTGATNYSWNFGDGSAVSNDENPSHTYTSSGVYTVTLTAMNAAGCSEITTLTITVDDVTSVHSIASAESVAVGKDGQGVYASYNFKNATKVKLSIYNALGEQVGETQNLTVHSKGQFRIETANLAKGVYTIEALFDSKKITRKLDF